MTGPRTKLLIVIAIVALLEFAASPVCAHAFGVRYDLPIPLGLFLTGAGAAVLLSFIVMARFLKEPGGGGNTLLFNLLDFPGVRWLGAKAFLSTIKFLSVMVFGLLIAAAMFGNPDPLKNISPTFVWVVWWVGMAFISALLGNLWSLINPWDILFNWFDRIMGGIGPVFTYPAWLDRWPAVALFLVFAWLELIFEHGENPRILAFLIFNYSLLTWAGMALFGRQIWLRNGEIFSILFGLLAKFAPSSGEERSWYLRPPGVGLISQRPASASYLCFVLLLLTTVTFDGILETPMWANILDQVSESQALRDTLVMLQETGIDLIALIKGLALLALPAVFAAVYFVFCHAIAMFGSGGQLPTRDIAGYFALSLVPIAIAYHLSHYLSYLLIAGQQIIPLLSDPFGWGWDLFGTTEYWIDIAIINAKAVWYMAVTAIVVGHVAAVYIAHFVAMRVFDDRRSALRSQLPMMVLMVGYTMVSLWILSQPIIS